MSNYHVLETSEKEHSSKVVFHITVPDENNGVGVNLRIALSQYHIEGTEVPWLDQAEITQINNGEIYEHVQKVYYDAELTVSEKRSLIDNKYNSLVANIPDKIRAILRFWGLDRSI